MDVFTQPVLVYAPPARVESLIHKTVTLDCEAKGNPLPEITWQKNGHVVEINRGVSMETGKGTSKLILSDMTGYDSGAYTCTATNQAGKEETTTNISVESPPSIKTGAKAVNSDINEPVLLECESEGIPAPTVTWYKNQHQIPKAKLAQILTSSGSLQLPAVTMDDVGRYTCQVDNVHGSEERVIDLNVYLAPTIRTTAEESLTISVGQSVSIPCEAQGNPKPKVNWFNNDAEIRSEVANEIHVSSAGELIIPIADRSLSGEYYCSAENIAGVAKMYIYIDVVAPPRFSTTFNTNVELFEHGTAIVTCEAQGTPKPAVSWQRNGRLLKTRGSVRQQNDKLIIEDASRDDDGSYVCLAQNTAGTALLEVAVSVLIPPQIRLSPRWTAISGLPFSIQPISVRGNPVPELSWYKEGKKMSRNEKVNYDSKTGRLLFVVLDVADAGRYSLKAESKAGYDEQEVVVLVLEAPWVRLRNTESNEIETTGGSSLVLAIETGGVPNPDVIWARNDLRIISNGRRMVSPGGIRFSQIKEADAGRYTVSVKNSAGSSSLSFRLIVNVPPRFTNEPPLTYPVRQGDQLRLTCSASGTPSPTVTWSYEDGSDISEYVELTPGLSTLSISNVSPLHGGLYTCVASNTVGENRAVTAVMVETPPTIKARVNTTISSQQGQSVTFDCHAEGDPQPFYSWTHNHLKVANSSHYYVAVDGTMTIRNVGAGDNGEVRCTAHNQAGVEHARFTLVVILPPKIVVGPGTHRTEFGDDVLLRCQLDQAAAGNTVVTWRFRGQRMVESTRVHFRSDNSVLISSAVLTDTGEYACLAQNEVGSDGSKGMLTVWRNGEWSAWEKFGQCSSSCGKGDKERKRLCNSPPPANGGTCPNDESSSESVPCSHQPCPINGYFTTWTEWSDCSVGCGVGFKDRLRSCIPPQWGGDGCHGRLREETGCNNAECIIDGQWGQWNRWEMCDVTCGGGIQTRQRDCDDPQPADSGEYCGGSHVQSRTCAKMKCPIDGSWGEWLQWSFCSVSCGNGQRSRERFCDTPSPSYGGTLCPGVGAQASDCNIQLCPINGGWSMWMSWSHCSHSCNGGLRQRQRTCDNPDPQRGGKFCGGIADEKERCGSTTCPVDGAWSAWAMWSHCSATCGRGVKTRSRDCSRPSPEGGGAICTGPEAQRSSCETECAVQNPTSATGTIFGNINGIEFGVAQITIRFTNLVESARIVAEIDGLPADVGYAFRYIANLITPLYWLGAFEEDGASNGYSLTHGKFGRDSMIEFPSGEILDLHCVANGVKNGQLDFSIGVHGHTPSISHDSQITIDDYMEDYVQLSQETIFGFRMVFAM